MNSKAIILFLAIVSVGGMGITSQAFADHHGGEQSVPLDFSTDSDTYDHSSVIEIDGAVVSKATLHNMAYINGLNLEIGCRVEVIRSGEIIPRIVRRIY